MQREVIDKVKHYINSQESNIEEITLKIACVLLYSFTPGREQFMRHVKLSLKRYLGLNFEIDASFDSIVKVLFFLLEKKLSQGETRKSLLLSCIVSSINDFFSLYSLLHFRLKSAFKTKLLHEIHHLLGPSVDLFK